MKKLFPLMIGAILLVILSAGCVTYGDHSGDWGCALVRESAAAGQADYENGEWRFLWAFTDDGPAIPVIVGSPHEDSCWNPPVEIGEAVVAER